MNSKIALLLGIPLALGASAGWTQDDTEEETRYGLPAVAADAAREASGVMDNDRAQFGLQTANEATMRLMDDAEASTPDAVTADIPMPSPNRPAAADLRGENSADAGDRGIEAIQDAAGVAADQAQDALEAAQEAIEERGRGNRPEDLPGRPEDPGPPDDRPGPPMDNG